MARCPSWRWPWCRGARIETMNIFFVFFYLVNNCVGTGFLGIPYAFFYSGYLAAVPTLLIIFVLTWIGANYVLEVTARAQALEYLEHTSGTTEGELEQTELTSLHRTPSTQDHPRFEIIDERKFEISELCEIFFGKHVKYAFLIFLSVYCFLFSLSFSTVAGTAWATNFPFHFGAVEQCGKEAFFHTNLPTTGGCLYAYYLSLTMFAVIVVTLSLFDLKEQIAIQVSFGLMRFITMAAMVIYCIVRLAEGGNGCLDIHNATTPIDNGITSALLEFDPRSWTLSIPVFVFAFLYHTSISSLSHSVKQKDYLYWLIFAVSIASLICYGILGIMIPLWFRASIQEISSLNWDIFTGPGHSIPLRVLSYYLVFFPSLDVISAYPINTHIFTNNLYKVITGQDTSREPKYRCDRIFRILLRFTVALVPILAAFGVSNLIHVLKYGGLFGFALFMFPFILQIRSIYVCKKKFSMFSVSITDSGEKENLSEDGNEPEAKKGSEQKPLVTGRKEKRALYTTPYSNIIFSRPVSAWIAIIIAGCFFLFGISGLFVHEKKLTCNSHSWY